MKIIRSFLLITVCLCATTLLHAQQAKNENNKPPELTTEVLKQPEVKIPSQTAHNTPSPTPELKPQLATEKPVAAETPKSLVSEEEVKPQQKEKPATKIDESNTNAIPGGEEGRKIFAGKAETPKQGTTTPNTIDQNMRPLPKAAVSKQQQQQ